MSQLTFEPKIPIGAITDEFAPALDDAIAAMKEIGMTAAELRTIDGKNVMDLSDDELKRAKEQLDSAGLRVVAIASPVLKCVIPNAPELDQRFHHDVFASRHTYEDQPRLAERALTLARFFKAGIVRVFSYWRTVNPANCHDAIVEALDRLARLGEKEGVVIGLENEHACNVATATEAALVLNSVSHANLKLVWDPANALVSGEIPVPAGYAKLPKQRIVHVHAKDCHMEGYRPVWGPVGTRHVLWREQIQALMSDGYAGMISLETHWEGPGGNKLEGSRISGWNLRALCAG